MPRDFLRFSMIKHPSKPIELQTSPSETDTTLAEAASQSALHSALKPGDVTINDVTINDVTPGDFTLRDVARYTPHVARLVGRCLRDKRVPMWRKSSLAGLALYLAMPFDLVPDFIPILGQADDLLLVVWVLRGFVRGVPPAVLEDHWDGDISLPQLMENAGNVLRALFKRRSHETPRGAIP